MRPICVLAGVLLLNASAFAADSRIAAGSKIFVDADKGFDGYLTAALQKKKVPLIIVSDKDRADYVLEGAALHEDKNWASKIFLGHRDTSEATIKLVNAKTTDVVYAYAVHKKNSVRGNQSTAEACAKHLKSIVGKSQ